MRSRQAKALYFTVARGAMAISSRVYRAWFAPTSGIVKVHLGPGQRNYIDGWLNVDANIVSAKLDVWSDLRDALPFRDGTVDAIYSHHVIEHLPDARLPFHFAEMYRCLKPNGVIRVAGPNGDTAIRKFLENDHAWFSDFPDAHSSIGGRFVNFILCGGEHLTILTRSYLDEHLTASGFVDIRGCAPVSETTAPELFGPEVLATEFESTPEAPHTLVVEARKP
jgi:predicted SAM-dependent methyltransferase